MKLNLKAVRIDFFLLKVANIRCFILIAVEIFHNIIREIFFAFHTFWKSASVFSLIKMHIVCYVLHAKFDVLVMIHVILLNISYNLDKILSIHTSLKYKQMHFMTSLCHIFFMVLYEKNTPCWRKREYFRKFRIHLHL
jgi:hypothetical protein